MDPPNQRIPANYADWEACLEYSANTLTVLDPRMGWAFIQSDSSWDDAGDSTPVSALSTASTRRRRLPLADDQADSMALSACKFSDVDIRAEYGIADDEPDVTRKTWKMKFVKCWRMFRDAHLPDIQDDTVVVLSTAFSFYLKKRAPFHRSDRTASSNSSNRRQLQ